MSIPASAQGFDPLDWFRESPFHLTSLAPFLHGPIALVHYTTWPLLYLGRREAVNHGRLSEAPFEAPSSLLRRVAAR